MDTHDTDWAQTDNSQVQHPILLSHLRPPVVLQHTYKTLRTWPARKARDGIAFALEDRLDFRVLHAL